MATFPSKVNFVTGDVLTATNMNDIGGAINLLDGAQFSAGKNRLINADMSVNQRAFTSTTTSITYGFDRWALQTADGTVTYSAQTFTPGTAPVAGYEAANFARIVTTGQTLTSANARFYQYIEDVRSFAGQTVTVSFYAKAATGTPKMALELNQTFGTGGSPSATVNNYVGQVTLSTSWARYSLTYTVPSISGKTIGTTTPGALQVTIYQSAGSDFNARTGSLGIQSNTFDIWGVQAEEADTASNFQTASATIQGELALCQRYFYAHVSGTTKPICIMTSYSAVLGIGYLQFPATMRATPSVTAVSGASYYAMDISGGTQSFSAPTLGAGSTTGARIDGVLTAAVAGTAGYLRTNNAAASLAFSSEL